MISLLVALVVSQTAIEDLAPPPPPPAEVVELHASPPTEVVEQPPHAAFPPGVPYTPQSVSKLEPRVSTGALVGRVSLSVGFGVTGWLLGELVSLGLVGLGLSGVGVVVGVVTAISLAALGVAIGSAMFGKNFARDFREVVPIAGGAVAGAALIGYLLANAFFGFPVLGLAIPLVAAAVGVPLVLQAMKPASSRTALRDAAPVGAITVASF